MKNILALMVFLAASNCFAGSICMVTAETSGDTTDDYGRIFTDCNAKNPDSVTIKSVGANPSYMEIATVLSKLADKGYKIMSQSGAAAYPVYTLSK